MFDRNSMSTLPVKKVSKQGESCHTLTWQLGRVCTGINGSEVSLAIFSLEMSEMCPGRHGFSDGIAACVCSNKGEILGWCKLVSYSKAHNKE